EIFAVAAAGDHDQVAMALLAARRAGERPDRRPSGSAGDEHERSAAFTQERLAMRAANLHAVPGPDSRAELGRDQPARQSPDMKHELGIVPRAVHATARAVFARREAGELDPEILDRKSTRLNSSHVAISYAVFCLKKKN